MEVEVGIVSFCSIHLLIAKCNEIVILISEYFYKNVNYVPNHSNFYSDRHNTNTVNRNKLTIVDRRFHNFQKFI